MRLFLQSLFKKINGKCVNSVSSFTVITLEMDKCKINQLTSKTSISHVAVLSISADNLTELHRVRLIYFTSYYYYYY